MKTLLLLRHAKSSWKDTKRADHDRKLSARGKRDAPRVGKLLRKEKLVPSLIVSSTARRARKTAEKVAKASQCRRRPVLTDALYMAAPSEYLAELRQLPKNVRRVLVVGHNPGLEELLTQLTGSNEAMPTAALAVIELEIADWSHVTSRTRGRLVKIYRPREMD